MTFYLLMCFFLIIILQIFELKVKVSDTYVIQAEQVLVLERGDVVNRAGFHDGLLLQQQALLLLQAAQVLLQVRVGYQRAFIKLHHL